MPIDEAAWLRLVRGENRGPLPSLARAALAAAALGYGLGVRLRNRAYDRGRRPVLRAEVPVVSVGNITLGGTGKTPMVEWVARTLREQGRRVAILSRGYARRRPSADAPEQSFNDEGRVLEENLPDVPHLQGPDRAALARVAVDELESEVLVLDDGFQHRRLARDLDLVMLDALDPFGLERLFPRGLLREPPANLRRASGLVISRADLVAPEVADALRARLARLAPEAFVLRARHAPRDLLAHPDPRAPSAETLAESEPLASLRDRPVLAFCGLGNPEGFRRLVERLAGRPPVAFLPFPDHHPYAPEDLSRIARVARESGADLALTTQKDLVKLRVPNIAGTPLRALRVGLEFLDDPEPLRRALAALVAPTPPAPLPES